MLTQKKNYGELKEEKEDLELRKETLEKVIEGFELDKVQKKRLIDSQKNQITILDAKCKKLDSELFDKTEENTNMKEQIEELEENYELKCEHADRLEAHVRELDAQLAKRKKEINELSKYFEDQKKELESNKKNSEYTNQFQLKKISDLEDKCVRTQKQLQ